MDIATVCNAVSPIDTRRITDASDGGSTGFTLDNPADPPTASASAVGARLNSASASQVLQSGQEADEENASSLPIGLRHYMGDIASDPDYAAEQAQAMAYSTPVVFCSIADGPKNGDPAEVWTAWNQKMDAKFKLAGAMQDKLRALYEDEGKQGVAPARIYADMLKLKASQPADTLETQGPSGIQVRQMLEDLHSALTRAMAKAAALGASSPAA